MAHGPMPAMMAAHGALNSSRVTGSFTLKKRGRSEASRLTKFALWDAVRRHQNSEGAKARR